ncbi:MAG: hypothetical protein ACLT9P_07255 [Evtepia gabavorous]
MFRQATLSDLEQIAAIYDHIHTEEEAGRATVGWVRGVYPTRQTALDAIQAGDMFVAEENGRLVATAKINQGAGPRVRRGRLDPGRPPGTGHGTPHPGGGPPGQGAGLRLPLRGLL